MRITLALTSAALALCGAMSVARAQDGAKPAAKTPNVAGKWTGTWTPQDPSGQPSKYPLAAMKLDCEVAAGKDGVYSAVFEGECGRPYKYKIKMDGRQAGPAVLFKGTTDLGPMDGGVYDWIGRASDKVFTGFYTSAGHVGVFKLERAKSELEVLKGK